MYYFPIVIKRNFFVKWFEQNKRDFPWRNDETSPFQFLVTEVLLQQTKADDVAKIWLDFFTDIPDAFTLSQISVDALEERIRFLGFGKKRANALKMIGAWLFENHDGIVPDNREQLLAIPYVGSYAAHAVLCFAFNQKIEIVDANVLRLFSRYYNIELNRDARRAPVSWEIARKLLPRERKKAKPHNYGLLDFTAQICKVGRPRCEICPLNKICVTGRINLSVR
jgi:A/G-specific adenine glycosylase